MFYSFYEILLLRNGYLHAFLIPPDFDDTFVNLGIGSLLTEVKDDFPASHAQWLSQNTNLTTIFDAVKRYAYRPLSDNNATNTVDSRAYFYLRYFLEDAVSKKQDVALIPTWVTHLATFVNRCASEVTTVPHVQRSRTEAIRTKIQNSKPKPKVPIFKS